MDLLDTIKANTTGETGFALLDDLGKQIGSLLGTNDAQYEDTGNDGLISITNEIEVRCTGLRTCFRWTDSSQIMRGTLNQILAEAARQKRVCFKYGWAASRM